MEPKQLLGMPLQESAILALQTYRSQRELFFLSLICCVQDSRSNVKMSNIFSIHPGKWEQQRNRKNVYFFLPALEHLC